MQENSQFDQTASTHDAIEYIPTAGATCDTYRVKYYGKWHFLKQLKQQYASLATYQQAFRKEFETGYHLEHPNLVRYMSLSDDGILMEYVDGETLTTFLQSHPEYFRSKKHSDVFLRQMLSVLQYLHEHQVLHLDLKPDNILITRIGHNVKLIDLGGCYSDCFSDTTAHTDAYAAPEQLQGKAVDIRTDLYALGKIMQLLPNHNKYRKIIRRCIEINPENRPSSAEYVRAILQSQRYRRLFFGILFVGIFLMVCIYGLFSRVQKPTSVAEPEPQSLNENDPQEVKQNTIIVPNDSLARRPVKTIKPSSRISSDNATPLPEYTIVELRRDIRKRLWPIYQQTYGALPDSITIYNEMSYPAGYQLQDSVESLIKELILAHGSAIPMKTISDEVMEYVRELLQLRSQRK